MDYETTYYWKIVAKDDKDATTEGPIWSFTTRSQSTSPPSPPSGPDPGISNNAPTADANGPYFGSVGETILFDGSGSTDTDGTITKWEWTFGDGQTGTGETTTHTYTEPGNYTITLKVTDDDSATDTDTTKVTIIQPNRPPSKPTIDGPNEGNKSTWLIFDITSTDDDNDTIQYTVTWDDATSSDISDFLASGETYSVNHIWSAAGKYTITVTASDNQSNTQNTHIILIDAHNVGDIGYLTDDDDDGTWDNYYNNDKTQGTLGRDGDLYLIDVDNDGTWDYSYDPETEELIPLQDQPEPDEEDNTMLYLLALIIIILVILFIALLARKGKGKPASKTPPKTEPKKSNTKKNNNQKKQSKGKTSKKK